MWVIMVYGVFTILLLIFVIALGIGYYRNTLV